MKPQISIVLDDEKYFTFTNDMSGNDGYYTNDKHSVTERVKFKSKANLEEGS